MNKQRIGAYWLGWEFIEQLCREMMFTYDVGTVCRDVRVYSSIAVVPKELRRLSALAYCAGGEPYSHQSI